MTAPRWIGAVVAGTLALASIAAGPPAARVAPEDGVDARRALEEGVAFLLRAQNRDGSWGSFRTKRSFEILADVPGSHRAFRVATTALCVIGLADAAADSAEARDAVDRGIDWLLGHYDVKRPNGTELYNVWSFGFTLHCFGEHLLERPDDPRGDAIREACRMLVRKIAVYQQLDGGWGYYDFNAQTFQPSFTSMSFTTATILLGVDRVRRAGIEVPDKVVRRAVSRLRRARTPEGSFLYGDYLKYAPRAGINQDKGSACRTPVCQNALELFGQKVAEAEKREGLDDLLVHHTRFQRVASRRPIPHESWYQVSGYFYLYGHGYAAYVLEEMPEEDQERLWPALVDALLYCRQPDGSFWDYPLYSYHKEYGTAFALIALSRVPR